MSIRERAGFVTATATARRPYLVLIVTVGVRVLQLKAAMPVMARPMIRMCTSSVPS